MIAWNGGRSVLLTDRQIRKDGRRIIVMRLGKLEVYCVRRVTVL
jgi:hypothetical protein